MDFLPFFVCGVALQQTSFSCENADEKQLAL